jgi:hypothetical protein
MNAVDVIFVVAIVVLLIVDGACACSWAERADGRAE